MSATTRREAEAATPRPIRDYPGFGTTDYTPTVGLSARPRKITLLWHSGVVVTSGTRSDLIAVLGHAPTREGFIAAAARTNAEG